MKKIVYGYILAALAFSVQSCKKADQMNAKEKPKTFAYSRQGNKSDLFYYARDKKVYLWEDSTSAIFYTPDSSSVLSNLKARGSAKVGTERLLSGYFFVKNQQRNRLDTSLLGKKSIKQYTFKDEHGAELIPSGELIVKLNSGVTIRQLEDKIGLKLSIVESKKRNVYVLKTDINTPVLKTANSLQESGLVDYSYPNFIANIKPSAYNDTYYNNQYYLKATGINMESVTQGTSSDIKVAVIDDGVSAHEDIVVGSTTTSRVLSGYTPLYPTEYGIPVGQTRGTLLSKRIIGHGQACAGIIAANRDNSLGIAGIAPLAKIIPVNIFRDVLTTTQLADAINWAWETGGADIINNSWAFNSSTVDYPEINDAIQDAITLGRGGKGCIVIFSTGNAEEPALDYPSARPGVIAVGAVNQSNIRQSYSNYGTGIDLVAPSGQPGSIDSSGEPILTGDVYSTDRMGIWGYNTGSTGNYVTNFGGTSAAAPQVSGAAALLLSIKPDLTGTQVANYLTGNATDLGATGYDSQYGYGKLNVSGSIDGVYIDYRLPFTTITGLGTVYGGWSNIAYECTAITGATNYQWSVSGGTIVSGQGTRFVQVSFQPYLPPNTFKNVTMKVVASASGKLPSESTKTIRINACSTCPEAP